MEEEKKTTPKDSKFSEDGVQKLLDAIADQVRKPPEEMSFDEIIQRAEELLAPDEDRKEGPLIKPAAGNRDGLHLMPEAPPVPMPTIPGNPSSMMRSILT